MLIRIKYFGQIQEFTKMESEELEVQDSLFKADLVQLLIQRYPDLEKTNFQLAVNQSIEKENRKIEKGSELALLPPFAGG